MLLLCAHIGVNIGRAGEIETWGLGTTLCTAKWPSWGGHGRGHAVEVPRWGRWGGAQAPKFSSPPNCGYAPKISRTLDTLWSSDSQKNW